MRKWNTGIEWYGEKIYTQPSLGDRWKNPLCCPGSLLHYWKKSGNLCPVHTTPEKFQNAALFLRLGLPSTLIRHENGAFQKRSTNQRNLKTPALRSSVDGKRFENRAFRKWWRYYNRVISLPEFSPKHKSKITGDWCVFKFLWRRVDGVLQCKINNLT